MSHYLTRFYALLVALVAIGIAGPVFAQQTDALSDEDPYNSRKQKFLSVSPSFQSWQAGDSLQLSQLSNQINLYFQLSDAVVFTLKNAQGRFSGRNKVFDQDLADLSGLGDSQITVSYRLPSPDLIVSVGANLPTGTTGLTFEETTTSAIFSRRIFDFGLPNLGQGLNLTGALSGAFPIGESFVLGLGAAYQINGAYTPLLDDEREYAPGDEIVVDAGFHAKISDVSLLGVDVLYTMYGVDSFGDQEVYEAGSKINAVAQYRHYLGHDELSLLGRYRTREPNAFAAIGGGGLLAEEENSNPDFYEIKGQYRYHASEAFTLGILGEYRSFSATADPFSDVRVLGFGLAPEFSLSDVVKIPLRIKYSFGDFGNQGIDGWDIGFGIIGLL